MPCGLTQVLILLDIETATKILGPEKREDDDVQVHATHEDAHDQTVLVPLNAGLGRQGKAVADCGFDGRRGGANEVAELVRRADDEGTEGSRGEFHQVDGDDAPGALHAELLEEGRGHNSGGRCEGVGVEERAADDTDDDDGEATPEDLGGVADHCAACHGTEVGYNLGHGDGVGGEVILVGEERGVEVLGAVGLGKLAHI